MFILKHKETGLYFKNFETETRKANHVKDLEFAKKWTTREMLDTFLGCYHRIGFYLNLSQYEIEMVESSALPS